MQSTHRKTWSLAGPEINLTLDTKCVFAVKMRDGEYHDENFFFKQGINIYD